MKLTHVVIVHFTDGSGDVWVESVWPSEILARRACKWLEEHVPDLACETYSLREVPWKVWLKEQKAEMESGPPM